MLSQRPREAADLGGRTGFAKHVLHINDQKCGPSGVERVKQMMAAAPGQYPVDDFLSYCYIVHPLTRVVFLYVLPYSLQDAPRSQKECCHA